MSDGVVDFEGDAIRLYARAMERRRLIVEEWSGWVGRWYRLGRGSMCPVDGRAKAAVHRLGAWWASAATATCATRGTVSASCWRFTGSGANRARTGDLRAASATLSQLSYSP